MYLLQYREDRVVGGAVGEEETINTRMRESRKLRENGRQHQVHLVRLQQRKRISDSIMYNTEHSHTLLYCPRSPHTCKHRNREHICTLTLEQCTSQ